MLSGAGGGPDPTDTLGVRVLIPNHPAWEIQGKLNSPASIRPFLDDTDKTVKPRGLSPKVLHVAMILAFGGIKEEELALAKSFEDWFGVNLEGAKGVVRRVAK